MSDFNAPAVWDAAAPRLFPGQTIRWSNATAKASATLRCVLGCPHKNGDVKRPSLVIHRSGGFKCMAFGTEGSLKNLVELVLGADAWTELGRLGAGAGFASSRAPETPEQVWARMNMREFAWTDRYMLDPELASRYLRSGPRYKGDLRLETSVAIYDALGRLVGIKSRLPQGCEWPGGSTDKYRMQKGSSVRDCLFLAELLPRHPQAAVVVVAGEKDALVAASHLPRDRWVPVSGCVGEGTVPAGIAKALAGRRVVIAYDPDPAGRAGAAKVWRTLKAGGVQDVRVACFPEDDSTAPKGEGKWDVAAVVLHGGVIGMRGESPGGRALEAILDAALPELPEGWAPPDRNGAAPPAGASASTAPSDRATQDDAAPAKAPRPRIAVTPHIKGMVDEAEAALVSGGVDVFQRAGQLVRVMRSSDAASIGTLPEPTLLETLSDVARWMKKTEDGDKLVAPPRDVVRALAARGQWAGLRPLEGVVRGPVLRMDGTVLDKPGYDRATALFFDPMPGVEWPTVAEHPTKADAMAALDRLEGLVVDFPFVAPSDRSAWLSLILTLVARPAIAGPTPLFLVRAPTPGSGKTLLVEIAGLIGTEAEKLTTQPQVVDDDAEEQKKMLTLGLQGVPLALIDNIDRPLGSAALASALTSRRVGGRLLGSNTHIEVPVPVFAATGNNVVVRADLARRVIPIDLDPGVERPEERTDFQHPNIATHVKLHRVRMRIDALTALRWYCAEGRPTAPCKPLGSYTEWTDLVRQTLLWLGRADPLAGMERIREHGDVELDAIRGTLQLWAGLWGMDELTALSVASTCPEELREALIALGAGKNERIETKKLGYVLRRLAGRVVGGYRLERRPGHNNAVRWRVVNLATTSTTATSSPPTAPPAAAAEGAELGDAAGDLWEHGRE